MPTQMMACGGSGTKTERTSGPAGLNGPPPPNKATDSHREDQAKGLEDVEEDLAQLLVDHALVLGEAVEDPARRRRVEEGQGGPEHPPRHLVVDVGRRGNRRLEENLDAAPKNIRLSIAHTSRRQSTMLDP